MDANEGLTITRGQKLWLALAVIGAGVSLWMLLVTGRVWQDLLKQKNEVDQLKLKVKIINELETDKEVLGQRSTELEDFLVKGEEGVAEVAKALEQTAARSGVELSLSFEDFPEKVDIKGKYQLGLGMNVQVVGAYQAVINWLQQVERLPYFVQLVEVKIGLPRLSGGVKADFNGTVYLKNE